MNDPTMNCGDCAHAYDGADNVLRCRIHHAGLMCSRVAYEFCTKFEREPGADGIESAHGEHSGYCDCRRGRQK